MSSDTSTEKPKSGLSKVPPRVWIASLIGLYSLLVIFFNWKQTEINFVFFRAEMPLTIALALTFFGGALTGVLMLRRRNKK